LTRFLQTGDLHLNAQRVDFPHYLLRGEWVLRAIEQTAVEHSCDCIVLAGDIFDRPDHTIAERQLVSDWLGRLEIPVLAISGNHDARSKLIGDTCLSYLSSLKLYLHLIHDKDPKIKGAFGCAWLLLPFHDWPHREFRLIVQAMVERIRAKDTKVPIIAVVHEAVRGCQSDDGILVTKNNQIKITDGLGVDYWALGHMHLLQEMLPNAFYAGAPHQTTFGEQLDKGVLIVDTDNLTKPQRVQLYTPYTLEQLEAPPANGEWPLFVKYRTALAPDVRLPDHVVYAPPPRIQVNVEMQQARVPLLHGLEDKLIQLQLPEELLPKTLKMATAMAEELDVVV